MKNHNKRQLLFAFFAAISMGLSGCNSDDPVTPSTPPATTTPAYPPFSLAGLNSSTAFNSFESQTDMQNPLGVYRTFTTWSTSIDLATGAVTEVMKSWNPILSAFKDANQGQGAAQMDGYVLTATGWAAETAGVGSDIDTANTDGSTTVTKPSGFTSHATVTSYAQLAGVAIQQQMIADLTVYSGQGLGRFATAVDPNAVFSTGALFINASDTLNQDVYKLGFWNDGGCVPVGALGNCNVAKYYDQVSQQDIQPRLLSDLFSIAGDTLPAQFGGVPLYKDLFTTYMHSISLMAASVNATTGTFKLYQDVTPNIYGAYDWTGNAGPVARTPVAIGTWNLVTVNGQQLIEYAIPTNIALPSWMQGVSKGFFAVHDGFVRGGDMQAAGLDQPFFSYNDIAMADIEANFSKMTYVYDPAKGGGLSGLDASQSALVTNADTWTVSGSNHAPDMITSMTYDGYAWTDTTVPGVDPNEARMVLDTGGSNTGFQKLTFGGDGLQTYKADGTIDFSMGGAGFGHNVNIGVTIDDVRGQRISDYVAPATSALFVDPYATFGGTLGVDAAVVYSSPYRSIGDRYYVGFWTDPLGCAVPWIDNTTNCNVENDPYTGLVATTLSQMITPAAAPVHVGNNNGHSFALTGLPSDQSGQALWYNNLGVAVTTSRWDIRVVHGVTMLYVPTPASLPIIPYRTDRVGMFYTLYNGSVILGKHASNAFDMNGNDTGKFNIDSAASGNYMFNARAIADIKAALGI